MVDDSLFFLFNILIMHHNIHYEKTCFNAPLDSEDMFLSKEWL